MREWLTQVGLFLLHALDSARIAIVNGAITVQAWLGVGWLVVLAVVVVAMALWSLRVHKG